MTKGMERTKKFIMNRDGIGFFKSILESYEDVGIFSVLDGDRGIIEIIYPSNFEKEIELITEDMSNYGIIFQEVFDA
jgi:hypothetical protein